MLREPAFLKYLVTVYHMLTFRASKVLAQSSTVQVYAEDSHKKRICRAVFSFPSSSYYRSQRKLA